MVEMMTVVFHDMNILTYTTVAHHVYQKKNRTCHVITNNMIYDVRAWVLFNVTLLVIT